MQKGRISLSRLLPLAAATMAMVAVGCAQQVGDIDRTQPNLIRKSDFLDSEWYIRQTLTDVPAASFDGFVGFTSEMERIRWEIREDYLIAWRSYEHNPGSQGDVVYDEDGHPVFAEGSEDGYVGGYRDAVIAMYPISGHYDIQRQYNSSTGEQTNVIVENSSDREWYERDYMRVDWINAIPNGTLYFDTATGNGMVLHTGEEEPSADARRLEYFDADNIVAPQVRAGDYPDGSLYYIDFINRAITADTTYCWGNFLPFTLDDCGAVEIEMTTSILRVPDVQRYEPVVYDDQDMQKFGFFRTDRLAYDRFYGSRFDGLIQLANRHNIWEDAWQRDADGEIRRDGEGRRLPLPMTERELRPVVYHLSERYPAELMGATEELEESWNRALRRAAAAGTGQDLDDVPAMFVVCHNPVAEDDHADCGAPGTIARAGDLRFNFIYWVHQNQMSGPLGYGPSSADPTSGEIIAGQAFVYGASVDTYAQYAVDVVRFVNGDLDIDDILDSEYVRQQLRERAMPDIDPQAYGGAEALERLQAMDLRNIEIRDIIPESNRRFLDRVEERGLNEFVARPGLQEQREQRLVESGLGSLLIDDEFMSAFHRYLPRDAEAVTFSDLPEWIREEYAPSGIILPSSLDAGERTLRWAERNNIMLSESMDDTIVGLARSYEGRTDYDTIFQELRSMIYRGVQEHEVGHTLGLRHNFQASYDALNYHDEFWEMKTEGVLGINQTTGEFEVVPFRRPQLIPDIYGMAQSTPAQTNGRMREYQYASIMDYDASFNTHGHGIGRYDEAAIIYGYTTGRDQSVSDFQPGHPRYNTQDRGYVEVFEEVGNARWIFEQFEGLDSPGFTDLLEDWHYSTVATSMASPYIQGNPRTIDDLTALIDRSNYNENTGPAEVRRLLSDDNRRLVRFQEVLNQREAEVNQRPIEVPYLFLSDYWNGARQSARTWDHGADPLEQALNVIERYETYYPFEYFRRERLDWDTTEILNRLASRYFQPLVDNYQRWLFGPGFGGTSDDVLANGWTFAAFASLNLMADVMTTPSYGSYQLDPATNQYELTSYGNSANADVYVPQGEGRRPFSAYDAELGYHYWVYPTEAGHFWAYYAAVIVMSASTSVEVRGADTGADFLSYSIPPFLVFQDEMTTLYNSLFTARNHAIAPRIDASDGNVSVRSRLFAPLTLTGGDILNPLDGTTVDPDTLYQDGITAADFVTLREAVETIQSGDEDDIAALDLDELRMMWIGGNDNSVLNISNGFTQEYLPMLYGMAFFSSNLSLQFQDQANIFRSGSGETMTPGPGFEAFSFCDPFSAGGECYSALMREVDEDDDDFDPDAIIRVPVGVSHIIDAHIAYLEYLQGSNNAEFAVENSVERMNILRAMYEAFGSNF